jgi:Zn finger protein HypA/HybF involved in hydrogenase expression
MLSRYLREGSQMARCKRCDAELQFDMDDTKDQIEVICPKCAARHVIRWVASSPLIPGAQFEVQLIGGGGGNDHGNG